VIRSSTLRALAPISLVCGALSFAGCGAPPAPGSPAAARSEGGPPDFELPALHGGRVRLSDHLGKDVILLDFWATFCEPCLLAMPTLDDIYQKQRARGFVVLGVSLDEAGNMSRVRAEVQKLGVTFPILLDQDTRVAALYNPRASAPYSVLIGRDGRVLRRQEGYTPADRAELEQAIEAALR
jgi:peroxiredoxin